MNWDFNNTYLNLPSTLYSKVQPDPIENPKVVLFNNGLAHELGLEELIGDVKTIESVFSGNEVPQNAAGIAQAYGGHQFGYFNVLGDGRAWLLGEVITPYDVRVDLQLKGSGVTPYSRQGDGRATLYSMLREYLISECMNALGVNTTRSLAVITGDDVVYRRTPESIGVLTRVAESHLRVGTFELAVRMGQKHIEELLNYAINRHYPEVLESENPPLEFLKRTIDAQISLVNDWLKIGFIHGVMNTDNMSIAGETIDYGPCAFMNYYNPNTVYSSIDKNGRYAYNNQSKIAKWNLTRLAETILHLIHPNKEKAVELAQIEFDQFEQKFQNQWKVNHLAKIGIIMEQDGDAELLDELFDWMEKAQPDYTNTFRGLADEWLHDDEVFKADEFLNWKSRWLKRINAVDRYEDLIRRFNPAIVPRNHIVESILLEASENDNIKPFNEFLTLMKDPFAKVSMNKYQKPPASEDGYQTFCGT